MHPTLPKENPGSKWPKTSLGAVRDGKRLTPEQLELLLRICRDEGENLQSGGLKPLEVNRAALCIFECRLAHPVLITQDDLCHTSMHSPPQSQWLVCPAGSARRFRWLIRPVHVNVGF